MRISRRRDERGAIAVFTAILSVVLLVISAFAVDLGNTWARRGQLQVQADRAATYAAQFLPAQPGTDPANPTESELRVAVGVAYYLACNPVAGQQELDPNIPACPGDDTDSATLEPYAHTLLEEGMVDVPTSNEVKVVTPEARIDFGLGQVAGVDGTIQRKQAAARITSPGMLAPIGLSLDCLLSTGANLLGGGGLPFGYISTTHKASSTPVTTTWTETLQTSPTSLGIEPGVVSQQLTGVGPTRRISGAGWPDPAPATVTIVFGLGTERHTASGTLVMNSGNNNRRLGHVDVTIPAAVVGPLGAGTWDVKVQRGSSVTQSTATLEVEAVIDAPSDVSCGRFAKSPREGTNANPNFALNLQNGVDHLMDQYPIAVPAGSLTRDGLMAVATATQCDSSNTATVKDTVNPSGTPNCLITKMSGAYESGFTEGMIGAEGSLTCKASHPCRADRKTVVNGREINNDLFSDFVQDPSLLNSSTFWNFDTYFDTGTPVVTPDSNLSRDLYGSHRFMWVAVISTVGATSQVQAGDYPVLTFRPIFITQSSALSELPLLDSAELLSPVELVTDLIDTTMKALLVTPHTDQEGLIMDGTRLSAMRFMTISPEALPAVPADYDGAESNYLGVGPKIVRLVK